MLYATKQEFSIHKQRTTVRYEDR